MATKSEILKHIVAALVVTVMNSAPSKAAEDVSALLQQLQSASEIDATRLEREIELAWSKSGSAAMDLLLQRGRDAMQADDSAAAIEHLTALTDHAPDFAEGWHARATAYFNAGLYGPALADLQRALSLNPDNFNAIFGLGVMFQEFQDLGRAETAFRQVLALHPHHENAKTALEQLKRSGIGRTL
ncbi:MAG: tetratricopeptide repeat protein [Sulfitobacter sp.]